MNYQRLVGRHATDNATDDATDSLLNTTGVRRRTYVLLHFQSRQERPTLDERVNRKRRRSVPSFTHYCFVVNVADGSEADSGS